MRWVESLVTARRAKVYTSVMAVVVVIGGTANFSLGEGLLDRSGHIIGADFLAFYTGGRFLLEGRLAEVYDFGQKFRLPAQLAFQRALVSPHALEGVHPFVNPPHAAVLYSPFASLPYRPALLLWWSTGLAALVASVHLLRRELPGLSRWSRARLTLGAFLFFPSFGWFGYGQITSVTILVLTGTFVLLRRGRDFAAGVCLGCLAYKPQLAMLIGIVLLARWRWRSLSGGVVAVGGWLALGWLVDPEATRRYFGFASQLADFLRYEEYPTWGIHSAFGFSALLLDGLSVEAANCLAWLLSGWAIAFVLTRWWRERWETGTERWDLLMAGTFAVGLIASPHLFLYDLMILLLPFGIVLSHCSDPKGGPLLEGGGLLAWSAVVWLLAFLGSSFTKVQLEFSEQLTGVPIGFQFSTVAILAWGATVLERARLGRYAMRDRRPRV